MKLKIPMKMTCNYNRGRVVTDVDKVSEARLEDLNNDLHEL